MPTKASINRNSLRATHLESVTGVSMSKTKARRHIFGYHDQLSRAVNELHPIPFKMPTFTTL